MMCRCKCRFRSGVTRRYRYCGTAERRMRPSPDGSEDPSSRRYIRTRTTYHLPIRTVRTSSSSSLRSDRIGADMSHAVHCKTVPFTGTLKPQGNGPLYSNTVIGTLAADGWAVTFGTTRRGLGGLRPRPGPHRCTKCNSPAINGQCTNFTLFDVAL